MTNSEFGMYKDLIQNIVYHGTKDQMENLYREILIRHGRDELKDLDRYNTKWTIDF